MIRLGLSLLILCACLLAASTWRVYGHTWDEPEHLAAGLELLDRGKYEYDTEHPPLARVMIALGPYLAGSHSFGTPPPDGTQEGIDILYEGGHYDRTLTLARVGVLPFLPLLLLGTWLWARRVLASSGAALVAVLLLISVPPILGHAALAALDVPAAATTLLALYVLHRWLEAGSADRAVLAGLSVGVAVATKLSAVPFIGLGVLVLLITRGLTGPRLPFVGSAPASAVSPVSAGSTALRTSSRTTSLGQRLGSLALVLLVATVPVLLAYGRRSVHVTELPARFHWVLVYLFGNDTPAEARAYEMLAHVRLPEAFWDLAEGVMALKAHNDSGHLSFLLGHLKAGGWWYFYPVDLAVKTPLPILIAGLSGLCLLARDGWRQRDSWLLAPPALFTTLLMFACFFSRINIGIRHVLILYPFMALGAAYLLRFVWSGASTGGSNTGPSAAGAPGAAQDWRSRGLVSALLLWQVSTLLTAYPDYLPYFNETVRHPEKIVVDSDLDWGQDLRRLELRLSELQAPFVSLAYQGTADLSRERLPPFARLPPGARATGWVAINALAREHGARGYAWLDAYRPFERIGKTIDLYRIPP